jgi:hypothetical protein
LDDFHWSLPFSAGVNPGTRYNHGACFYNNQENEDQSTVCIVGGLGGEQQTFQEMKLFFLTESYSRSDIHWGKVIDMTNFEVEAQQKAQKMIFSQTQYLNELDHMIGQEGNQVAETNNEIKKIEQSIEKDEKAIEAEDDRFRDEEIELDKENDMLLEEITLLFAAIKHDQWITTEVRNKNK